MARVIHTFALAVYRDQPEGAIVPPQWHPAETAALLYGIDAEPLHGLRKILADQQRLPRADHILGEVISSRPLPFGHAHAILNFNFESQDVAIRIPESDVKIACVKEALHFHVNLVKHGIGVERRAERAADFI